MDPRLQQPLEPTSLVTVAGLAAGYGHARGQRITQLELETLAEHPEPVALAVRLTHRVFATGPDLGVPAPIAVPIATELLAATDLPSATRAHAHTALQVAAPDGTVAPDVYARYLDARAAVEAGFFWTDLVDGACAALRAAVVSVAARPLGTPESAQVLARAAAFTFPR